MAEPGMKIAGATLANLAEGKLEEQFQDQLAKVAEVHAESVRGDMYEVTGNAIVCEAVTFKLSFPGYEDVYTRARLDAASYLQAELGELFLVALGKAETGARNLTERA